MSGGRKEVLRLQKSVNALKKDLSRHLLISKQPLFKASPNVPPFELCNCDGEFVLRTIVKVCSGKTRGYKQGKIQISRKALLSLSGQSVLVEIKSLNANKELGLSETAFFRKRQVAKNEEKETPVVRVRFSRGNYPTELEVKKQKAVGLK